MACGLVAVTEPSISNSEDLRNMFLSLKEYLEGAVSGGKACKSLAALKQIATTVSSFLSRIKTKRASRGDGDLCEATKATSRLNPNWQNLRKSSRDKGKAASR